MDLKSAAISCIERMPDNEETDRALKHIYAIAKKAGKETRCAPKCRNRGSSPSDMRDEALTVMVRNRMSR